MDDQNALFFLKRVPDKYIDLKEKIHNEDLKSLYSKFKFLCFEQNEDGKSNDDLYNFLKQNNFFIYMNIPFISNQTKDICDSILCFENYCLFIKSSIISLIRDNLKDKKRIFIDLNSENYTDIQSELSSICSYFNEEIQSNEFVKITLKPIGAYIIRRYFVQSNNFKDQSFFLFKQKQQETNKNDLSEFDAQKMLEIISEDKDKIKNLNDHQIDEFDEKDFIILRQVHCNSYAIFYLAIHIKSFYIFLMKKISNFQNLKLISHEIEFNKKYSHRCLTPFYGFLKEKKHIIGFIYEFMSNGTLNDYVSKNKEKIDETYSYMTMIRIAQGIKYLHANSLIHRDIKPYNILVNHDNIPYISDFDTIRKIEGCTSEITQDIGEIKYIAPEQYADQTYSFPIDIYSFGQLIYFLFEKEDCLKDVNFTNLLDKIKSIKVSEECKIPKSIQSIFKKCISFNANDRPTINEILLSLYNEFISFPFLKISFLKKFVSIISEPEIQQYFKEMYYLLLIDKEITDDYFNSHKIEIFQIINIVNHTEISNIIYTVGLSYYEGKIVQQDYHVAKEYLDIAAEMDNADAFCTIGRCYQYGQGVEINYEKAKYFYEIAAKQNQFTAINNLGVLYAGGFGVEKDIRKANEYFELAAKNNNPYALNNIGVSYLEGIGVEVNYEKARKCFELAKDGDSMSLSNLGLIYWNGLGVEKNYEKARECFELAVERNNPNALSNLGCLYAYGHGVEKNYEKAIEYFELAAKQNIPSAFLNLGEHCLSGEGCKKDYKKAKEYFELAIKHGCTIAYYGLGLIYKRGLGEVKDYIKAKCYFEKSIEHPPSSYQLGKLYYHGKIGEKDFSKAKYYFEESAKQDYDKSLYQLGILYKNGEGVEQDYNQSIKYFELAAQQDNPKAIFQMGILHFYHLVDKYDYNKAKEYFDISSKNNLNSFFYLGQMYEKGLGVELNLDKSIEYYKQCANSKNSTYLSQIKEKFFYDEKNVYNDFYYQSNNELGLIYITQNKYFDKNQAEIYLKEAGLNEHPFGQNSLALYILIYRNLNEDAKYLFEKASKKYFALSEYNLGYMYEQEGDLKKSIDHYIKASNYENEEIVFRNQIIKDEELEISTSFVICFTNLKLSYYYLTHNIPLYEQISTDFFLNTIFRPLFSLICHSKSYSYTFCLKLIQVNESLIITNLKEFIIGNPLFYYEQKLQDDSQCYQNPFGWTIEKSTNEDILELNLNIQIDQSKGNINSIESISVNELKSEYNINKKNQYFDELNDFDKEKDQMNNHSNEIHNFKSIEEIEKIFEFMNKRQKYEIFKNVDSNIDIIKIKSNNDKIERFVKCPNKLCEILINTMKENQQEIINIINEMKDILYKYPYKILFGRIGIYESEKSPNLNKNVNTTNVNDDFYGGLGNDI